jgi:hypothetical protein
MPLSGSPAPRYEPRTPETSVLYRTVHAHLEAFLVCTAGEEGRPGLPGFVKREFEAYLRCGILTHGFARVRCEGCAFEDRQKRERERRRRAERRRKVELLRQGAVPRPF